MDSVEIIHDAIEYVYTRITYGLSSYHGGLNMQVTRKKILQLSGITAAGTFFGGISFLNSCKTKPLKLKGAKETTTICPFCAVGCGLVVAVRDGRIINIEGDPDHPINKGSLCSKGSALYQISTVNDRRLTGVLYRAPFSNKWEKITWDDALKKIAGNIKKTRDETFIEKEGDYVVNRANGLVGLGGAALDNEECYAWTKMARILGISYLEHQARI